MDNKYQLILKKEQLDIISKSLDLYARIQMGQISQITNPYLITLPDADYTDVENKLSELKTSMFPQLPDKSYYSIKSKKVPDLVRQAVDIFDVISHKLAWDYYTPPKDEPNKKPEGGMFKNPFHWSSEIDLPRIEKVGEKNDNTKNSEK